VARKGPCFVKRISDYFLREDFLVLLCSGLLSPAVGI